MKKKYSLRPATLVATLLFFLSTTTLAQVPFGTAGNRCAKCPGAASRVYVPLAASAQTTRQIAQSGVTAHLDHILGGTTRSVGPVTIDTLWMSGINEAGEPQWVCLYKTATNPPKNHQPVVMVDLQFLQDTTVWEVAEALPLTPTDFMDGVGKMATEEALATTLIMRDSRPALAAAGAFTLTVMGLGLREYVRGVVEDRVSFRNGPSFPGRITVPLTPAPPIALPEPSSPSFAPEPPQGPFLPAWLKDLLNAYSAYEWLDDLVQDELDADVARVLEQHKKCWDCQHLQAKSSWWITQDSLLVTGGEYVIPGTPDCVRECMDMDVAATTVGAESSGDRKVVFRQYIGYPGEISMEERHLLLEEYLALYAKDGAQIGAGFYSRVVGYAQGYKEDPRKNYILKVVLITDPDGNRPYVEGHLANLLARKGIPTPRAIGYVASKYGEGILFDRIQGYRLGDVLSWSDVDIEKEWGGQITRAGLLSQTMVIFHNLHEAGYGNGDGHPYNFMVDYQGKVWMVDLGRVVSFPSPIASESMAQLIRYQRMMRNSFNQPQLLWIDHSDKKRYVDKVGVRQLEEGGQWSSEPFWDEVKKSWIVLSNRYLDAVPVYGKPNWSSGFHVAIESSTISVAVYGYHHEPPKNK